MRTFNPYRNESAKKNSVQQDTKLYKSATITDWQNATHNQESSTCFVENMLRSSKEYISATAFIAKSSPATIAHRGPWMVVKRDTR